MKGTSLCFYLFIGVAGFTLVILILLSIMIHKMDKVRKKVYLLFLKIPKEHVQTLRNRVDEFLNDYVDNSSGSEEEINTIQESNIFADCNCLSKE